MGRLGTAQDTTELRRRIAEGSARFKGLAQEFRAAAARHPARDSSAAQKLLRDFQGLLRSSERLMESARAKEAASLPRPAGSAAAAAAAQQQELSEAARADAERRALLEEQRKQELLGVENALQFNEAVIEERDQAIVEITGQIGEVGGRAGPRPRLGTVWAAAVRPALHGGHQSIASWPSDPPPHVLDSLAGSTAYHKRPFAAPPHVHPLLCPVTYVGRCTRSSRTWQCWWWTRERCWTTSRCGRR